MKWKIFLFTSLVISSISAQEWRSELYPLDWRAPVDSVDFYDDAFVQDFSYAGYKLGEEEIPSIETNIIDVTAPPYEADPSGETDATSAIQSAIDQASSDGGGVIFLPSGTYKISLGDKNEGLHIYSSNIVLRGEGIDKTFIYNDDTSMYRKVVIRVEPKTGTNWDVRPSEYTSITSDLRGPTQEIPVLDPSLFSVGDSVIIRNYPSSEWVVEHNEPEWNNSNYFTTLDGLMHYRIITAVDAEAKSISIDAPTRYVFLPRDDASVYKPTSNMISQVGLEDFSIGNREVQTGKNDWLNKDGGGNPLEGILDNNAHQDENRGAYHCSQSYVFHVERLVDGWLRNISSYQAESNIYGTHILSNGLGLFMCRGITVENMYMGHVQYGGGSGNGYAYRIESNDCLFKEVTAEVTRHGFSFIRMYSNGNVVHKGSCIKSGKCTANSTDIVKTGSSGSDFHQWFSPSNLIDQFSVDESYFSALHRKGVGSMHNAVTAHSVFWNFTAMNSPSGYAIRTSQTRTGYVIGTQGNTPNVNYRLSDPKNFLNTSVGGISPAFRYDSDGSRTSPEDFVEGEGVSHLLLPQSLYLDQLDRRLNGHPSPVSAVEFPSLNIYPNPSNGVFTIGGETYESMSVNYTISNLYGQILLKSAGQQVDISSYPAGVYFLLVTIDGSRTLTQILKQ